MLRWRHVTRRPAAANSRAPRPRKRRRHLEGAAVFAVFAFLMIMPVDVTPLAKSDVWSFSAHAHGVISRILVRGPTDSQWHAVWVWRPPGPDSGRIPVLYFLHGDPGGPRDAFRHGLAAILDHNLEEGYPPFVVACPDGNGEHYADTEWANSADGSEMIEGRLLDAVIPAVEGGDRRDAARRGIAGFSMGGYGAMNMALRHPGMFGQVVSIAGYFDVNDPAGILGSSAAAFAANSPDQHVGKARGVRILLDEDMSDDNPVIKGQAAAFAALLERAHIPATLRITPGQHDWHYAIGALANSFGFLAIGWDRAADRAP